MAWNAQLVRVRFIRRKFIPFCEGYAGDALDISHTL